MKNIYNTEILKDEFIFWSRLGYGCDPPKRNDDGTFYTKEPLCENAVYHREMYHKANIKIHTSIVCSGWMGDNSYDYSLCDSILEELFRDNEDIYFIPRVKLNAPIDWCLAHPEELWVYPHGPSEVEKIRALVGTKHHDLIGTSAATGIENTCIARQSLCSKKWLEDASEAFLRFLEHVENGSYADRIIGYHFGYGKASETHPWSGHGINGDFGISARKNFYNWALNRYGSSEELQNRWEQKVTPDCVPVPVQYDFQEDKDNLHKFFYQDGIGRLCYDYTLFMEETHVKNITALSRIVKEKTGKLAGIFHGYVMHPGANYVGHTDLQKILEIPSVDFIAAPKSYYRYEAGEPCTSYCVPMSVNRRKLWVEEVDLRTHLSALESKGVNKKAGTDMESRVLFWREFARCTMSKSGQWWMDLGGGWYHDDILIKEISAINDIKHKLSQKQGESISEILIVVDEACMRMTAPDYSLHIRLLQDFVCEMNLIGAPSDVYLLSDLEHINLSKYKVIAFSNAFEMGIDSLKKLGIPKGATVIWNYAAGILGEGFDIANIEKLTGFMIKELKRNNTFPYIEIINPEKPLLLYKDALTSTHPAMPELTDLPENGVAVAERIAENGGKIVYAALPVLRADMLRKIAEEAGVNLIAPDGCVVYGDSRYIGIFSSKAVEGKLKLNCCVKDVTGGEIYDDGVVNLVMKEKDMRIFLLESLI